MLPCESNQMASKSLHMEGEAIDVQVAGMDLDDLRDAALCPGLREVGFCPPSGFGHDDIGRVRF